MYPEGPRQRAAWWRMGLRRFGWLILLAFAMIARRPDAFFNPQFWAEDAVLFHAEAEEYGVASLVRPALGYHHLIPRAAALFAVRCVDATWQPALFNYAALLVSLLVLASLTVKRWEGPPAVMLGCAAVLVPQAGEILFSLTNVQWFAALGIVVCAVTRPPATRIGMGLEAGGLLVVSLTGPFAVALWPLAIWRWWSFGRTALLSLIVLTAGAAIQGWTIAHASHPGAANPELIRHGWIEIIGFRLFAQTFIPASWWPVSAMARTIIGVTATILAIGLASYPGPYRRMRAVFLVAAGLIQLAVCFRMNAIRDELIGVGNGPRYFFDARILLAWLLIAVFAGNGPRLLRVVAGVGLTGWLMVAGSTFRVPSLPDLHWARYAAAIREGRPADIPVNPIPYVYHYRGHGVIEPR